ncbi:MAG: ABC transporter substrate-binding protein [Rhodobacteraceae bacterium]|jgi:peptide/nickel transport system substrate-binding protein|nr:ABC transporter substrate-binding protein [Paracoccaceae bacterium]
MRPTHHLRRLLAAAGLAAAMATATPVMAQDGPRFGGTFVAAIAGEPGGLNPVLFQGAEPQIAAAPMFDPLIQLDMVGNPRGVLAESWTVSDDRTTVTFTLREGVRWHDGKPLTSADVLWTFMGTRDGYMPHPRYRSTLDVLVDRYEAPDPRSFTITLKQPYAPFLRVFAAANYAMPIVPKHVYEGTDIPNNPAHWAPVGSGPFKFREWVRGSHIELVRNEDYFIPDQPRVDSVFIRIMPDETARLLALRQGEVDYLYYYAVAYSAIPALQADPAITVTSDGAGLQGLVQLLALNIAQPPFDDVRVRRALAHLIDRELINRLVYFGLARPTVSNIGITTPFWTEEVQQRHDLGSAEANLAEAERLLDEAGHVRGADGNRFTVSLMHMTGRPYAGKIAEILDESLRRAGIRMTATPLDRPAFIEKTHGTWEFTVAEQQFSSGAHPYVGIPRYLLSSQHISGTYPSNSMGYANPELDALFAASVQAGSDAEEAEIWARVQRILSDDLPVIPIVEMPYTNVHRSEWRDVFSSVDGVFDVTRTVWSVNGRPTR